MNTKKLIGLGLIDLMDVYTYEDINITMISQEADISRRTFYRHFSSKDEVIVHIYHLIFDKKTALIMKKGLKFFEVLPHYFRIYEHNKNIFKKLFVNNKQELIRKEMKKLFINYNTLFKPKLFETSEIFVDYYLDYHTSAMLGILSTWVLDDCTPCLDDIIHIYLQILNSEDFHE